MLMLIHHLIFGVQDNFNKHMETKINTNETYDSTGRLILRVIVEVTTYDDGQVVEKILSVEEF